MPPFFWRNYNPKQIARLKINFRRRSDVRGRRTVRTAEIDKRVAIVGLRMFDRSDENGMVASIDRLLDSTFHIRYTAGQDRNLERTC
jgi:hypothetical protein